MMYQDEFVEIECSECGGAGFFGNGPVADACSVCSGTGVVTTAEPLSSVVASEPTVEAPLRLAQIATSAKNREAA